MKIVRIALIGCLFALLSPGSSVAQNGIGARLGKWWKNGRIITRLKLTPAQQAKIEALWTQNRQALIEKKAELDKRREELSAIIAQTTLDETNAMAAYNKLLSARSDIERSTFLMRVRIKNILTPEQQRRLEAISPRVRNNSESDSSTSDVPEP